MYQGMHAETVRVQGHHDDEIEAYYARPLGTGPFPAVVVLHHAPGWDEWSTEATRKLAHNGYLAICPNLHHREGPGSADDMAAAVRSAGGVPDDRCLGDVEGSLRYLRSQSYASGRIGIIGFCSGGRQAYLMACKIPTLNAAVDCWGGRVIATPEQLSTRQPVSPIDLTKDMACPLLGIFGEDDANPSPADVARTEEELKRLGKTYEFHSYKGAGHGFFAADRPAYRPESAVDGWRQVFAWFDKYLRL